MVAGPADLYGGLDDPGVGDRIAAGPRVSSGMRPGCGGGCCGVFRVCWDWSWSWRALVFGGDWLKERREAGRPLPPADSPNVLLIVMDTVRADHLSLYGYDRPTTPDLERWRSGGFASTKARATAPWTLPSHASLFTGRWPHELDVEWMTPLRGKLPDAGRVPRVSWLRDRGFRRQYPLIVRTTPASTGASLITRITSSNDSRALRTACLVDSLLEGVRPGCRSGRVSTPDPFRRCRSPCSVVLSPADRKDARIDQSRIPRLALATARARTSLLRLPQLLRCPYALCAPAGCRAPLRPEAPDWPRCWPCLERLGVDRQAGSCPALSAFWLATPMTIASPIWTSNWASCSRSWSVAACSIGRCDRHRPTMAKDWGSTACSTMARVSTAPRSACRS